MNMSNAARTPVHLPANHYADAGGVALVGRLACPLEVGTAAGLLQPYLAQVLDLIGGVGKAIRPGDSVLIKPNFNSPDPCPASADVEFVAACVELLRDAGAGRIAVGESSGLPWHPTRAVLDKTGLLARMAAMDVPVRVFDEEPWEQVDMAARGARYLETVRLPLAVGEYDRIVFLPNLKTHRLARFTMSLKLSVGLMHPDERKALHSSDLEEKVAELALAVRPDLILLDGRAAFVTRGPATGELVHPALLMAGGDQVSLDVAAVQVLQSYQAENRLDMDVWDLPQIKAASELGLGPVSGKYGMRVVEPGTAI
jgi:uncharacterized protein (DUF362 family)